MLAVSPSRWDGCMVLIFKHITGIVACIPLGFLLLFFSSLFQIALVGSLIGQVTLTLLHSQPSTRQILTACSSSVVMDIYSQATIWYSQKTGQNFADTVFQMLHPAQKVDVWVTKASSTTAACFYSKLPRWLARLWRRAEVSMWSWWGCGNL